MLDLVTIEDAIYHPDYCCIYDADGRRIDHSMVIRGNDRIPYPCPENIDVPDDYINQDMIYGGAIRGPFGHILTEGFSRLWYALKSPKPVICHERRLPGYVNRLLRYAGIRNRLSPEKPTRLKSVVIPKSTFRNGLDCDSRHLNVFTIIGRRFAVNGSMRGTLYLSRKMLPSNLRKIVNEEILEKGTVVCPEDLLIEEQIELINRYDHVAGCIGSALHLLLFRVNPIKRVSIYCANEYGKYVNYRMIDSMRELPTDYIEVLRRDPTCDKQTLKRDFLVDEAAFKTYA